MSNRMLPPLLLAFALLAFAAFGLDGVASLLVAFLAIVVFMATFRGGLKREREDAARRAEAAPPAEQDRGERGGKRKPR